MSLIDLPFNEWLDNVSLGALSTRETVQASYDIARLAIERGVPGDFVECGVFGGAQCAAMARAIMDSAGTLHDALQRMNRRVHLFDCFSGIPAPGPHDTDIEPGMGEAFNNQTSCCLEDCKRNMRAWGIPDELLVWHPGLFQDTVGKFANDLRCSDDMHIAVLRLDGDLYESTRVCLEDLYPLISKGGWCIIDDIGLVGARKAVDEYMKNLSRPTYWQKS